MSNDKRPLGNKPASKRFEKPKEAARPYLPQTGWFADWQWAEQLGQSVERFRELVRLHGVPHRVWSYMLIVRAEDFYEHARWSNGETTSESAG
jgi:hypothetical protein